MTTSKVLISCIVMCLMFMLGCNVTAEHVAQEVSHSKIDEYSSSRDLKKAKKVNEGTAPDQVRVSRASWPHLYTFEELVNSADLIVRGTIESLEATRALPPLDSQIIFTDYRLNISDILKSYPGFHEQSITVTQYGGTFEGVTSILDGDEPFQIGEEVFLFLRDVSDDPIHTVKGESKFSVMLPGGRFKVSEEETLQPTYQDSDVAQAYDGKSAMDLENDIRASLPDLANYSRNAVTAFLIVEGVVGDPISTLLKVEDTQSIYTVYPLQVEAVIQDQRNYSHNVIGKTSIYQHEPVKPGEKIFVMERGGKYGELEQRWAWSQGMQPGTRVFLFLAANECNLFVEVCSQAGIDSTNLLYLAWGGARFEIATDDTLVATTRDFFSQIYNGVQKQILVQDLAVAKEMNQAALDDLQNQADDSSSMPIPPTPTE